MTVTYPSGRFKRRSGTCACKQPRVRDRRPVGERETFRSVILPPYLRKTTSQWTATRSSPPACPDLS